jgi:hypothetical protein
MLGRGYKFRRGPYAAMPVMCHQCRIVFSRLSATMPTMGKDGVKKAKIQSLFAYWRL